MTDQVDRRGGRGRLTEQELAAWVQQCCAAQGVPVKVTDSHVVGHVAALLGCIEAGPPARQRGRARSLHPSEAPHDLYSIAVE